MCCLLMVKILLFFTSLGDFFNSIFRSEFTAAFCSSHILKLFSEFWFNFTKYNSEKMFGRQKPLAMMVHKNATFNSSTLSSNSWFMLLTALHFLKIWSIQNPLCSVHLQIKNTWWSITATYGLKLFGINEEMVS